MARKAVCLIRVLQGIDRVSISIDAGVSVSISKKSAFPERECQPNLNLQSRGPSVAIPERLEVKLQGSRYSPADNHSRQFPVAGERNPRVQAIFPEDFLNVIHKKCPEQHLKKYKDPIRLLAENAWLKGEAQVQRSLMLPEAVV